ncbi:hypothetical protein [Kitasatospora sp. MAA4]|uniref:hypothetical protein n=1 Tax=Kitasatospora sp. MAA4 TaxID=3035093 RepID=UPI002475E164|nr:hypothetical protein [Kitasatospora sp. MAA4]
MTVLQSRLQLPAGCRFVNGPIRDGFGTGAGIRGHGLLLTFLRDGNGNARKDSPNT